MDRKGQVGQIAVRWSQSWWPWWPCPNGLSASVLAGGVDSWAMSYCHDRNSGQGLNVHLGSKG